MGDAVQPTGAVTLDYAMPPEDLRAHLSVFYEFRADVPSFEDTDKADLAQFRINLAGEGEYRFADGHVQRVPKIQIVGPTTGPTHISMRGPVHTIGVGLLPAGWGTLLDFEASLLVNRVVDAVELLGDDVRGAPEALSACTTFDERVAVGSALARRLIAQGRTIALDFTRIVDDWLASPYPEVDDLVRATGLSRRQVERRCNAYYGSPPKMLARKYRALKATIAMARGQSNADALLDGGFYDQSHFIREIKAFTGVTPTHIHTDLPTLAALTLKRSEFDELDPLVTKA
ncbi:helix-turn-helix domain-containing protein [Sphingomonas sp. SUN039]|uniref:helix-turn-helix domain-containing protein n=1 Tax=Sphingomonas sp. SUN039 TaxID=2937787 RepID=UPI0021641CA9|nr:helix-turn-helix domain-containing protein [Sphingomonas sp. SUN039]UVO54711.1 helix-turn-helix domain-containing protein [Sphingomonas sp. SUN039]